MHLWHALLICAVTLAGCAGMDAETPQNQLPTNDTRPADGEGPQQGRSEDIQEGLHPVSYTHLTLPTKRIV